MSGGPYRDGAAAPKRVGSFDVRVTVRIHEVQTMVREYLLSRGWDPRKLPAPEKLDCEVDATDGGAVIVTYTLDGEAP